MLHIFEKLQETETYYTTIKDVRKWHGILNAIVFNGIIPKFYDIVIVKKRGQFAASIGVLTKKRNGARCIRLEINPFFKNFKTFILILAHEMIHSWEWVIHEKMTHSKQFFQWKCKLEEHGIPLNRCYHRKKIV